VMSSAKAGDVINNTGSAVVISNLRIKNSMLKWYVCKRKYCTHVQSQFAKLTENGIKRAQAARGERWNNAVPRKAWEQRKVAVLGRQIKYQRQRQPPEHWQPCHDRSKGKFRRYDRCAYARQSRVPPCARSKPSAPPEKERLEIFRNVFSL